MSVNGFIENGGEGIIYIHSGVMSGQELAKKTRDHYRAFDNDKLRYQIMDFREVERIEMTSEEIKETAKLFCEKSKTLHPDHKFAIVISNDPMMAILKLWKTYLEDPDVQGKIFYSMDKARAWIAEESQQGQSTA